MPQPLRAVENPETELQRSPCWLCSEIAEIAPFRLDREKDARLGVANQFHSGAKHLPVDEILKRTEKVMPEETRSRRRSSSSLIQFGYAVMVLFLLILSLAALVIIAEALR